MKKRGEQAATDYGYADSSMTFSRLKNPHLIRSKLTDISINELNSILHGMIEKYHLPYDEVLQLLNKTAIEHSVSVPVPIFKEKALTHLEALIKYLKDTEKLSYEQISKALHRDNSAVSAIHRKACKKKARPLVACDDDFCIPLSVFGNRQLSILENLTEYLKDTAKLRYHEIANLIDRDQRTIWTSYMRAKQKRLTNGF
jgi:hypothetical protein